MFVAFGEYTFIIYESSVAIGLLHFPAERLSLQGAPSATTDDLVIGQRPGLAAQEHEVCVHSFPDESSLADAEECGRIVAHQLHQPF